MTKNDKITLQTILRRCSVMGAHTIKEFPTMIQKLYPGAEVACLPIRERNGMNVYSFQVRIPLGRKPTAASQKIEAIINGLDGNAASDYRAGLYEAVRALEEATYNTFVVSTSSMGHAAPAAPQPQTKPIATPV